MTSPALADKPETRVTDSWKSGVRNKSYYLAFLDSPSEFGGLSPFVFLSIGSGWLGNLQVGEKFGGDACVFAGHQIGLA